MNAARLLYPVKTLGPGNRIGLWLCGCRRGCPGCSNPELWEQKPEYEITTERILSLIRRITGQHPVDGFTISGGEPMDQAEALAELLPALTEISGDILIYSGYTIEELKNRHDAATDAVLSHAAVLVDGPYLEERNRGAILRGSDNQRVHILKDQYSGIYHEYLSKNHNQIQNFTTADGIVSVGIHNRGFTRGQDTSRETPEKGGQT